MLLTKWLFCIVYLNFSEIVQDVASKGLSLVYESGDENLRRRLVNELLETLTTGRRTVVTVTEDTKIFEDESLGKSPTGYVEVMMPLFQSTHEYCLFRNITEFTCLEF